MNSVNWTNDELPSEGWRRTMFVMACSTVVIMVVFRDTVGTLMETWARSRTFAHGFLVIPTLVYLIWMYRDRLSGVDPRPSTWGGVLLAVAGLGWGIGRAVDQQLVQQVSVLLMIPGLIWLTLGTRVFRTILFPLGFLLFALPIGTEIEPSLQTFTSAFVFVGLLVAGIPVEWDGYFLAIPSGTWEIVRDCGGLRYLLPGLAVGYVYVAVLYRRAVHRLWFLILCAGALLMANGLRATAIIVCDHHGIVQGADHRLFSYTIYAVTMVLLFWVGLRWENTERADHSYRQHRNGTVAS